jgi:H+/gluconate symporter-like permease
LNFEISQNKFWHQLLIIPIIIGFITIILCVVVYCIWKRIHKKYENKEEKDKKKKKSHKMNEESEETRLEIQR